MLVGLRSRFASPWCAFEKSNLKQKRFVNSFDSIHFFGNCGGNGVKPNRAAGEFFDEGGEDAAVDFVEAVFVDAKHGKSFLGDFFVYFSFAFYFGDVPYALEETVGDTRGATGAGLDESRGFFVNRDAEDGGVAMDDFFYFI